jgi:ABC-type hemin transport system substrate-binding protein
MPEKAVAPADWRALAASQGAPDMRQKYGPQRIVCLTEEPTEWLYLLGEERRIVGISGYTVRPPRAREEKPKVSAFLSAKIDRIVELQPDCVIGFSDLQADIASQLVKKGIQVTIFNQRSVAEIFSMMYQLAAMVGQEAKGLALMQAMQARLLAMTTVSPNWPGSPWARAASLPTAARLCGATPTSFLVPGAAAGSARPMYAPGRAGRTSTRSRTTSCLK